MKKMYLGDSVYVDFDGYALTLTTENGLPTDPSNQIVLEPNVYRSLVAYVEALTDDAVDPVLANSHELTPRDIPPSSLGDCVSCDSYILNAAEFPHCPSCARLTREGKAL